jgi:hypothetical protein
MIEISKVGNYGRWLALLLCLFIVLLALHAKVSLYDHSSDLSSVASLKMWVDGQKVQVSAIINFALYPCFFAFLILALPFIRRRTYDTIVVPITHSAQLSAFQFHRFLRPPPAC